MSYSTNSTPTELLAEIGRLKDERNKKDCRLVVLAEALKGACNDLSRAKTDVWWALFANAVADMILDDQEVNCSILSSVVKYQDELDAEKEVGA